MALVDDLAFVDATSQAELVGQGEIQASELVEAAIERIERANPALNAVITPMYEQARQAADELTDGAFAGVPFLLKDLVASYNGVRMASGAAVLRDFVADHDSELVVRLKKAGLIIVGLTNTPELGCHTTTEPRLFGPTRNPWDTTRMTGGSSGGAAAAVAAGLVPMAHGNDAGGSIRMPAACCGVFGLKPTRARNPLGPDLGDVMGGLLVEHALTRSVRDSAALLDATAGPDPGAPYWAAFPERPFVQDVGADPGRLRIAFATQTLKGIEAHPDCVDAARQAAQLCQELGHEVVEAQPDLDGELVEKSFDTVFSAGMAAAIDGIAQGRDGKFSANDFEPLTWYMYEKGCGVSAGDYLLAVGTLQRLSRDMARFFSTYDIWLTPTLAEPPVPLGTFDFARFNSFQEGLERILAFMPFTQIFNATGQPAMSVPLYWNAENLPVGTHFAGRYGDEATLFRLAGQLEEARPWAQRRPPLGAAG